MESKRSWGQPANPCLPGKWRACVCVRVCVCVCVQINGITGETFRYSDILNAVRCIASGLSRLGVRCGDIVACISPNSHDYIFILFAVMCNGAPVAAINPSYTTCELLCYCYC